MVKSLESLKMTSETKKSPECWTFWHNPYSLLIFKVDGNEVKHGLADKAIFLALMEIRKRVTILDCSYQKP